MKRQLMDKHLTAVQEGMAMLQHGVAEMRRLGVDAKIKITEYDRDGVTFQELEVQYTPGIPQ
jgi:hypothetical protein